MYLLKLQLIFCMCDQYWVCLKKNCIVFFTFSRCWKYLLLWFQHCIPATCSQLPLSESQGAPCGRNLHRHRWPKTVQEICQKWIWKVQVWNKKVFLCYNYGLQLKLRSCLRNNHGSLSSALLVLKNTQTNIQCYLFILIIFQHKCDIHDRDCSTPTSCLLRIVDSFGTEPAFNLRTFAKQRKKLTSWGGQDLNPQQFFTMFRKYCCR